MIHGSCNIKEVIAFDRFLALKLRLILCEYTEYFRGFDLILPRIVDSRYLNQH
jgi:hypothetical protein